MTKKDIVRTISDEVGLTQQQTKKIVQRTFDSIIDTLVREGRIELRNFGVFEVKSRAARRARNPKTGDEVIVPEKHVVTFKPGKYMESRVQEADLSGDPLSQTESPNAAEFTDADNNDQPSIRVSGRWDEE
ncbi:MAG: HU family DNA-binding protein [Planctomycetota bacterium]